MVSHFPCFRHMVRRNVSGRWAWWTEAAHFMSAGSRRERVREKGTETRYRPHNDPKNMNQ